MVQIKIKSHSKAGASQCLLELILQIPPLRTCNQPCTGEAAPGRTADHWVSLMQEGGQLYTWGGAFEGAAGTAASLSPRLPPKDTHQGCLGHGDKAGRLSPCRSAMTKRHAGASDRWPRAELPHIMSRMRDCKAGRCLPSGTLHAMDEQDRKVASWVLYAAQLPARIAAEAGGSQSERHNDADD